MEKPKKIVVFYSQAGGGHETMAKIIQQELGIYHNVVIKNITSEKSFSNKVLTRGYVWLTEKTPLLWGFFSIIWKKRFFMYLTKKLMWLKISSHIKNILDQEKPDMVISTYYLVSELVHQINTEILTYTIVSDIFAVQKIWFYNTKENYIVFSEQAFNLAKRCGVPSKNIFLCEPVFNNSYLKKPSLTEIALCASDLKINLKSFNKKILIVGGGSSIPNGEKIFEEIIKIPKPLDMYVICGRNTELENQINFLKRKNKKLIHNKNIYVYGFIPYIRELINMSDIIITKSGPGIIFEILSQQKPMLLSYYIWEQEKPNMEFVINNKFGIYEPEPQKIASYVDKILETPEKWNIYKNNTKNYTLINGLDMMIQHIHNQL